MSTHNINVVLNCLKLEKKLLWGMRNIFWRKTERSIFFHIKWFTKVLKIIYWKKKTPKAYLSQSNAAILKLWCPYVYQWFISCAITLLTKRALKSVELNELYPLFFILTCNILLTFVLNLKTVPAINDVVRLGESTVLFKITLRGH